MKRDGIANGLVSAGKNTDAMDAFTGGLQNQLLKSQAWTEEGLRGPHPSGLRERESHELKLSAR